MSFTKTKIPGLTLLFAKNSGARCLRTNSCNARGSYSTVRGVSPYCSSPPASSKVNMSKYQMRPLVISSPSGGGKSTLIQMLMKDFPNTFGFSISYTTRPPRKGETDGKEYHFVDRTRFSKMIEEDEFVEYAEYSGQMYGTSRSALHLKDKICLLEIEMQGIKILKKSDVAATYVFVKPPSMADLEIRLKNRKTETPESISARMAAAKLEIQYAETGVHDFIVVNDNLECAYKKLKEFVASEYKL